MPPCQVVATQAIIQQMTEVQSHQLPIFKTLLEPQPNKKQDLRLTGIVLTLQVTRFLRREPGIERVLRTVDIQIGIHRPGDRPRGDITSLRNGERRSAGLLSFLMVSGAGGELFEPSGGHVIERTGSRGPRGDPGFLVGGGDGPCEGELQEDEGGEER